MNLSDLEKKARAATQGEYHVERVDHDHGEITYEVSSGKEYFHVVFRESDCIDVGISAKAQAEHYASFNPTTALELIEALKEARLVIRFYDAYFRGMEEASLVAVSKNANDWLKRFGGE